MKSKINFTKWLFIGVLLEVAILGYSYFTFLEIGEVFRHAARYSGRLSLIVYIIAFYFFATTYRTNNPISGNVKKLITIFCILHFIHFGFLAINVYLNNIQLIPYKLAGGFVAYAMVLVYPFLINKFSPRSIFHFIYFYYVGIVMALTYVARIKGEFEGASPEAFHYFGIGILIFSIITFTYILVTKSKKSI